MTWFPGENIPIEVPEGAVNGYPDIVGRDQAHLLSTIVASGGGLVTVSARSSSTDGMEIRIRPATRPPSSWAGISVFEFAVASIRTTPRKSGRTT